MLDSWRIYNCIFRRY